MKHLLVFSTVLITIFSSLLLDYTAHQNDKLSLFVLGVIALVFCINILKFGIWGWIHKKFDVTKSYPLTASFFPLIFLIAYFKGDTELSITKIAGVVLIVVGLFVFEVKKEESKNG
ncbi:MAG: hypothetical protein JKY53_06255 [Flavobacteriales bacterium]|nr:hypothetical protein [Flavobacteriales bacterium]